MSTKTKSGKAKSKKETESKEKIQLAEDEALNMRTKQAEKMYNIKAVYMVDSKGRKGYWLEATDKDRTINLSKKVSEATAKKFAKGKPITEKIKKEKKVKKSCEEKYAECKAKTTKSKSSANVKKIMALLSEEEEGEEVIEDVGVEEEAPKKKSLPKKKTTKKSPAKKKAPAKTKAPAKKKLPKKKVDVSPEY